MGRDWATLASTPNIHTNRFAALPSTTDDEGAFETVQSRKSKRKRQRAKPQQQSHRSSTGGENTHPHSYVLVNQLCTVNLLLLRNSKKGSKRQCSALTISVLIAHLKTLNNLWPLYSLILCLVMKLSPGEVRMRMSLM